MKNLFLSLALVLVGTFAFANVNLDQKSSSVSEEGGVQQIPYTLSCGYHGSICCMSGEEAYEYILAMEEFMC
jgi:hypothetical protein